MLVEQYLFNCSIIVVWNKGLLVGNRVMGGHPVANQGVARMDKQNKQVMAGLVQLKFIQAATTVETLKQLPQQMNYLFKMHDLFSSTFVREPVKNYLADFFR